MMMQMPQMMMPMNIQYQMPPQMYNNIVQQQQQQQQPQKTQPTEVKEKDTINTNGTADMKDDQEVQDELDQLRPTYNDINKINQIMEETKSDDKMANSQFMQFLSNLKNKPPVADQEQQGFDQSQMWANQFQGWNEQKDVDAMNWDSYME